MVLFVGLSFVSCDKDNDGGEKINPDNLFAGTWERDGSGGDVIVVLTESTWTATYQGSLYNSGTYTYDGNTAIWKITNKGIGSANVGDAGSAIISNNKMTVSSFSDEDMNGQYTKQASTDGGGNDNGDWILINGVKWTTRNVGASSPEDYGNYYTDTQAQTVCPTGWRLPTRAELQLLINSGSTWTTQNGVNGRRFGSGTNTIFLPAAGARYRNSGNFFAVDTDGYYWSNTEYYHLNFNSSRTRTYEYANGYDFCVRCVAE